MPGQMPCHLRFIPTGVGNTRRNKYALLFRTVHPHGCGEHLVQPPALFRRPGSSPRVWGTLCFFAPAKILRRFIPTGVGNTGSAGALEWRWPVHPHGCGEHRSPADLKSDVSGSSPRVWGTRQRPQTPQRFAAVHPHGCGEHKIEETESG